MEEETERESDRRREMADLLVLPTPAKWRRLQWKNLNNLGLLKRKEWPQCHRKSGWQERLNRPCRKEQSRLSRVPDHNRGESRGGRDPHLGEKERRIRARAWSGKGRLHGERRQIPRRKGRASKKSLSKRSRRKHERVSGRKNSPGRSAESWFHSKSGQT